MQPQRPELATAALASLTEQGWGSFNPIVCFSITYHHDGGCIFKPDRQDMSASSAAATSVAQTIPSEDDQGYSSSPHTTPPTLDDIDRWQCHIGLQEFGEALEAAAKAVFPNDAKSRYTQVFVLMLCWEDEDPQLPVSLEVNKLCDIFAKVYHFQTEKWSIPDHNCHAQLNQKILDFVSAGDDSTEHLKIVYYAGHARLTKNRLLTWTRYVRSAAL